MTRDCGGDCLDLLVDPDLDLSLDLFFFSFSLFSLFFLPLHLRVADCLSLGRCFLFLRFSLGVGDRFFLGVSDRIDFVLFLALI